MHVWGGEAGVTRVLLCSPPSLPSICDLCSWTHAVTFSPQALLHQHWEPGVPALGGGTRLVRNLGNQSRPPGHFCFMVPNLWQGSIRTHVIRKVKEILLCEGASQQGCQAGWGPGDPMVVSVCFEVHEVTCPYSSHSGCDHWVLHKEIPLSLTVIQRDVSCGYQVGLPELKPVWFWLTGRARGRSLSSMCKGCWAPWWGSIFGVCFEKLHVVWSMKFNSWEIF